MIDSNISLKHLLASEAHPALPRVPRRTALAGRRMVFVVGCPRSGTTLVGSCLGGHPLVACGQESLFLLDLWRIITDLHQGHNTRGWAPLAEYVDLDELLGGAAAFADLVFEGLMARSGGRTAFVDHTPWYASLTPLLTALYPGCYVIHVIRDGRDVVRSLGRSWEKGFSWAGADIRQRAELWRRLVEAGRLARGEAGDGRYVECRYEDLSSRPREVLAELLDAVGLPWSEEVLRPLATPYAGPSRDDALLARIDSAGQPHVTPRAVAGGWPGDWSHADKADFMAAGGDMLSKLGYA